LHDQCRGTFTVWVTSGVHEFQGKVTIYIYKINVKTESKVVIFSFQNIVAVTLDTPMYACTHAYTQTTIITSYHGISGFSGLGVSMLAFSTQVRGFKPGRSRRIFKGEKILSAPSFGGEVKPSVPCCRFAACKKSLNVAWKSTFRQNYQTFLAHRVPPFATRGLSCCVVVGGAPGDRSGNV